MAEIDSSEMFTRFSVGSLPSDHLAAMGMVCARYAVLEMSLITTIKDLAGITTETNAAITAHMATPLRLSVFQTLANLHITKDAALVDEAAQLVQQFRTVASKRADIVHPYWTFDTKLGTVHRAITKARTKLERLFEKQSIDHVKVVIDEILALTHRFARFHVLLFGWNDPLPPDATHEHVKAMINSYRIELNAEFAAREADRARNRKNQTRG